MTAAATERPPAESGATAPRPRWRMPWLQAIASLTILLGVCVLLYPQTASWFSQREQSRVVVAEQEALTQPPNDDARYRAEQIELAHDYNARLSSGALFEANARIPVGDGEPVGSDRAYDELLAVDDNGFMGRLKYDDLAIDLPIYHGTDDDTLERGVGHLEGTSLPVGGIGTRSVLTAHRGLPESTLFTDLDEAAVGDTFTVSVYDQVLAYRVVETQVIDPDDTEAILADPDRDLVTLVTCTPLGINTQRILVTGERVTPTPEADLAAAAAAPDIPGFPWWALALGGTVLALGAYVQRAGRAPIPNPARRPQGAPTAVEELPMTG